MTVSFLNSLSSLILASFISSSIVTPAAAQSSAGEARLLFTVEFKRFPEVPSCLETFGSGTVETSNAGKKVSYVSSVFDPKSQLRCTFSNGNSVNLNVGFWFDEYVYRRSGKLEPGKAAKIKLSYNYRPAGKIVVAEMRFSARNYRYSAPGNGIEITKAMLPERQFKTRRWKK